MNHFTVFKGVTQDEELTNRTILIFTEALEYN